MKEGFILEPPKGIRAQINNYFHKDEKEVIASRIAQAQLSGDMNVAIKNLAIDLIERIKKAKKNSTGIDSFLSEYSLASDEGIALMCLAEALLRVPDAITIDALIKDKLAPANWKAHKGQSHSMFVNATTWALIMTGKVLSPEKANHTLSRALYKVVNRSSEGVIRKAVEKAMKIMSRQFVMGADIQSALKRAKKKEGFGYLYSYDMLGEAALTSQDAKAYFDAYMKAIHSIGKQATHESVNLNSGISIKLSALHPRYENLQKQYCFKDLCTSLLALCVTAKKYNIAVTVDAEESERLDISLDIFEHVIMAPELANWNGLGLALQSYQKRAYEVLDWIYDLGKKSQKRINVRLIKGAYWDSEIKKTQMQGFEDYPVFTRKCFTDVSFQACAKKILSMTDVIFPQFATHNALSAATILKMAGDYRDFEFQCLHGMGTELYDYIVSKEGYQIPCRIYAPVGIHEDLLPYLVRRLLENGANSSFVNRLEEVSMLELTEDPVLKSQNLIDRINKNIPKPADIFLPSRMNAKGFDPINRAALSNLIDDIKHIPKKPWHVAPQMIEKVLNTSDKHAILSPQNRQQSLGDIQYATIEQVDSAIIHANEGFKTWSETDVDIRVENIIHFAHLLEKHTAELIHILSIEAGKTIYDSIAEIREAVDFCYYYANQALKTLKHPTLLNGYTGETNELRYHPRGIILCISPWNFPLAIFVGQIVAALAAGNSVIAKPAEQTSYIAQFAINLMYEARIPKNVIQCLPGKGEVIGAKLVSDKRIKGVVFTGSVNAAHHINLSLANKKGEITPLIAETGGMNAMIVDSSALLEQVTKDVLMSAFGSAGQRCSACRVLYIQDDIYNQLVRMLQGAMAHLNIGDPSDFSTDVGPVIDEDAYMRLSNHIADMKSKHTLLFQSKLPESCEKGFFIAPTLIQINRIQDLKEEVFGPILHVIPFKRQSLDKVIQDINNTGYGLTFGIHSRVNETVRYVTSKIHVGNVYVNRNMIGAIVGLQPFGGEGLSGTGPKAGGPNYLKRFCHERVITIDTTAAGGNASLMALPEE